ncbi:hypothetical protein QF000_005759 [Paraburkholderia atlantica]|uniref:hypothetical protein n=1 Tax=Paraburkholderia atlantica TaxID=2654982 RepID=UPI003D2135A5
MLDNLPNLHPAEPNGAIMTIKLASYAAFSAAERQVARDMQAFRQMMSAAASKAAGSGVSKASKRPPAAKNSQSKKGARAK